MKDVEEQQNACEPKSSHGNWTEVTSARMITEWTNLDTYETEKIKNLRNFSQKY